MFDLNHTDKQPELFSNLPENSKDMQKNRNVFAKIAVSLSYENLFIVSVGFIIAMIGCYCLGVEKGKKQQAKLMQSEMGRLVEIIPEPEIPQAESVLARENTETEFEETSLEEKIRINAASKEELVVSTPYIQIATFHTDKYANKEIERLKSKGYSAFVISRGKYKEVCVGGYKSEQEVAVAMKQLKKLYADCILHK